MNNYIKYGINYGDMVVAMVNNILVAVRRDHAQQLELILTGQSVDVVDFGEDLTVRLSKGYFEGQLHVPVNDIRPLFHSLMDQYKDYRLSVDGGARLFLIRTDCGGITEHRFEDFYLVESEADKREAAKYRF